MLQVQARPSDIEGFNLQVRARAWLAQSARWSVLGFAGLADHQLDVPVGGCGPHTAEWQESLLQAPGRPAEFPLLPHAPFRSWVLAAGVQQAAARCWC